MLTEPEGYIHFGMLLGPTVNCCPEFLLNLAIGAYGPIDEDDTISCAF